jgi:hypothetical protein
MDACPFRKAVLALVRGAQAGTLPAYCHTTISGPRITLDVLSSDIWCVCFRKKKKKKKKKKKRRILSPSFLFFFIFCG